MVALYSISLQTILPLPAHLSQKMQIVLTILADRMTRIRRVPVAMVKGIQPEAAHTSRQVCTPNEEKVLSHRSFGHLAELRIWWVRKPGEGEGHLI